MVWSLAPNKNRRGRLKIMKIIVREMEKIRRTLTPFPRIFSARSLSPFPRAMEARGAPPAPINALNAEISIMMGKVSPTPVSAIGPTLGICPMYILSIML